MAAVWGCVEQAGCAGVREEEARGAEGAGTAAAQSGLRDSHSIIGSHWTQSQSTAFAPLSTPASRVTTRRAGSSAACPVGAAWSPSPCASRGTAARCRQASLQSVRGGQQQSLPGTLTNARVWRGRTAVASGSARRGVVATVAHVLGETAASVEGHVVRRGDRCDRGELLRSACNGRGVPKRLSGSLQTAPRAAPVPNSAKLVPSRGRGEADG